MGRRDVLIILVVALVASVGAFFVSFEGSPAMAQGKPDAGGIIAIPLSLGQGYEILVIIDTNRSTMATYSVDAKQQVTFNAAREYKYDLQVPEYNTAPRIREVKEKVEVYLKTVQALEEKKKDVPK